MTSVYLCMHNMHCVNVRAPLARDITVQETGKLRNALGFDYSSPRTPQGFLVLGPVKCYEQEKMSDLHEDDIFLHGDLNAKLASDSSLHLIHLYTLNIHWHQKYPKCDHIYFPNTKC